jgi:hypothetical protein
VRAVFLGLVLICGAWPWQTGAAQNDGSIRFAAVDIYLDSTEPVAAWQFELNDRNGVMKIAGVENGESAAFERVPYYDREAVQLGTADRIVVADFSLADASLLPSGRIRIATLHLVLSGADDPAFDLDLVTAVTHNGQLIDASISLESRTGSEQ